jgi:hypothetical protein
MTVDDLVGLLLELGESASVSATVNVCRRGGGFVVEPGAHAVLPDCDRDRFVGVVWPAVKLRFALDCGWMDASTPGFRGCTENFSRPSSCPQGPLR